MNGENNTYVFKEMFWEILEGDIEILRNLKLNGFMLLSFCKFKSGFGICISVCGFINNRLI